MASRTAEATPESESAKASKPCDEKESSQDFEGTQRGNSRNPGSAATGQSSRDFAFKQYPPGYR